MAFLKVELNKNINIINEWLLNIDLYKNKVFTIEEIELSNPTFSIDKNDIVNDENKIIIEPKHNIEYEVKKQIKKYLDSYEVFKEIYSIGDIINKCLIDKDIKKFDYNNQKNEEYKKVISIMLSRKNNFDFLYLKIINIISKYGFIYTTRKNDTDKKCVVIDLLLFSYLIYETYTLYYCFQNGVYNKLKIYNYIKSNNKDIIELETINNNIIYLDNNIDNTCYFETIFDDKNEKWDSFFVFDNPLSISLYELKHYLSFDVEGNNIGICRYCLNPFERIGTKQKTCKDYECITKRANDRKIKSNNKKKTTKSN